MAPKTPKGSNKKPPKDDLEKDPVYSEKRKRNNDAVKKSRKKAKKKAHMTKQRVTKLKEDNKILEGKIDEQRKTKKFLKELFLTQSINKSENPTKEQLELLEASSDEDVEEESDKSSEEQSESSDEASSDSPDTSAASSKKLKKH